MAKKTKKVAKLSTNRAAPPPVSAERALRFETGIAAREQASLESHGDWTPASDRSDPVSVLDEQNATRLPELVPIRWGRMSATPFTLLRGAAAVMAMDLSTQPQSGVNVQLCGDAHLSNFGMYATPERNFVFDLNDFDETLPGPFEWDVKRLAASLVVAAQNNGISDKAARALTEGAVRAYCQRTTELADMPFIEVWYSRITDADIIAAISANQQTKGRLKQVQKNFAKARHKNSLETFPKLAENVGGQYVIRDEPPLIVHQYSPDLAERVRQVLDAYISSLQDDRKILMKRYSVKDVALKVVGVGSVGTRCIVALFMGDDDRDPLFLQAKEANQSVLSKYLGDSEYANMGARVVEGQRLTQAASDMFLGWARGEAAEVDYYFRQLRDMKLSAEVETMMPEGLAAYGRLCAFALARAHARSGDPAVIAGYVGDGKIFSTAIAEFAVRYADQTVKDHEALVGAIRDRRLEAVVGI